MDKYPSIVQYRNVIRSVRDYAAKAEIDIPTISYVASVKVHGTNGGIIVTRDKPLVFMSRNRILNKMDGTVSDNYGFVHEMNRDTVYEVLQKCLNYLGLDSAIFYGEWCGPGIQDNVATSKLNKKIFIIFNVKINDKWYSDNLYNYLFESLNKEGIYLVNQFYNKFIDIDFNRPEETQNQLVELTEAVEKQCPVGKFFGIDGVGEGLVWKPISLDEDIANNPKLWFKVKGEKHSVTKVSKLANIDPEVIRQREALVESLVTPNRLEQAAQEHVSEGYTFEIKHIRFFLSWVFNDIIKEDLDTITASGFTQKNLSRDISILAKRYYMKRCENA